MTQSVQAVDDWDENVRVGFIISLIFCALITAIFCISPNIYLLYRHYSENEPLEKPDVDWAYLAYNDARTTQRSMSEENQSEIGGHYATFHPSSGTLDDKNLNLRP